MMRIFFLMACCLPVWLLGQTGVGFRFSTNLNSFPRADELGLVNNAFTTGVFGVFFSQYHEKHGFEAGLNVVHKGGGFNLPVVMEDLGNDGQNLEMTAIEMDLKVGPRLGAINPKIGYILGYRVVQRGFLQPGFENPVNPIYLMLPFGASFNLPTQYGSVGAGAYYNVGIFNVLSNPGSGTGAIYNGGRHRYLNLEMVVTFGNRMPKKR